MQSADKITEKAGKETRKETWKAIMNDLYEFGKSTNDEKLMKQAVVGQHILNEQKQTENWLKGILKQTNS